MPFIQFPDVPIANGVPQVRRPINALSGAIGDNPAIAIASSSILNVLGQALDTRIRWGLFDSLGNLLGMPPGESGNFAERLITAIVIASVASLSVLDFQFAGESAIADYQIERGSFESYNKVNRPDRSNVRLAFRGSDDDRAYFVAALRLAKSSTDLFTLITPEVTLTNQSISDVRFQRRSQAGIDLIVADVDLQEIRTVSVTYAVVQTPIVNPVNPAATPTVNSGSKQTTTPEVSTLKSLSDKFFRGSN